MRRILGSLVASLALGLAGCYTCDVCDDCGDCITDAHYGVYQRCHRPCGSAAVLVPASDQEQAMTPVSSTARR